MDKEEIYKQVSLKLLSLLRGVEFDLIEYKATFARLYKSGQIPDMQQALHDARKNPELRKLVIEKYAPIEKGLLQLGQNEQDKALLQALKSWTADGPTN